MFFHVYVHVWKLTKDDKRPSHTWLTVLCRLLRKEKKRNFNVLSKNELPIFVCSSRLERLCKLLIFVNLFWELENEVVHFIVAIWEFVAWFGLENTHKLTKS